MAPLRMDELVRPLTVDEFIRRFWGVQPFSSTLRPAVLDRLQEGFHKGEVAPVLAECRKVDNSAYSADEVSEMERDLDGSRRTLNLPYCFCEGALELSAAFIDDAGAVVNVADMTPQSTQTHCAEKPVRYVLEMNAGWFAKRGFGTGTRIGGLVR